MAMHSVLPFWYAPVQTFIFIFIMTHAKEKRAQKAAMTPVYCNLFSFYPPPSPHPLSVCCSVDVYKCILHFACRRGGNLAFVLTIHRAPELHAVQRFFISTRPFRKKSGKNEEKNNKPFDDFIAFFGRGSDAGGRGFCLPIKPRTLRPMECIVSLQCCVRQSWK